MTVFDKARELGMIIADSEQAEARNEAMERFLQNEDAIEIMEEYEQFQQKIETEMQKGTMTQEQFMVATTEMRQLGAKVKAHPVAGAYIESVNNFNKLLKQVFQIVQATASGQMENGDCDGCGMHEGGCSCGCGNGC